MVGLLCRNDGCEGGKREVNTRETTQVQSERHQVKPPNGKDIRNQVGLELVQVNVERTVEAKRGSDGRNNLSNQPVQVCEAWGGDAKVLLADIVDGLIVDLENTDNF